MEVWLDHLVTQSLAYSLLAVMLVALLESMALVGLLLPGTVMMASLGTLVGSGQMGLYPAWGAGIVGCLLGDWISYFIGRVFRQPLHNWSFLRKHQTLMKRTEHALHQHHISTVLIGRFVGPTRPLIPMVAGMLELPPWKFALPNIIGCLLWPPIYLLPGILTGVAIDIPANAHSGAFKLLLLCSVLLIWLAGWLIWRWWRAARRSVRRGAGRWLTLQRLRWLTPLATLGAGVCCILLLQQPLMPVYRHLLWQVLLG
ncbi:DedA family protein [Affinibrenneria salicis]|uniref:DedA family protein n=1 Tax=Affinibrenneria salicis TaxID=2590031 RepID=A0A5J5G7M7_9GAMM|nr:DedA family protein [Affinibrenneria salicis]KAA9003298.1 DedA family protein [Affinibrenneria salicis]KAA9003320.1 DedA family protein [Affinibrenneria salicis]